MGNKNCEDCGLFGPCNGPILPEGSKFSKVAIVGESPGPEEDKKGRPFVGDTGYLLNYMLKEVGLPRKDVYLTNAVSCFPFKNKLTTKHADFCKENLISTLTDMPNLQALIIFGNIATHSLLNRTGIADLNGYWWSWRGKPTLALLHPTHTLRSLAEVEIQIKHFRKVKDLLT